MLLPTATDRRLGTFALNTEPIFDWQHNQCIVPINFAVAQLPKLGGRLLQVGGGARNRADGPASAPTGWGARFTLTLLLLR